MRRLLIIGAGGHARAVLDVVAARGEHVVAGLIDDFRPVGSSSLGYSIVGGEAQVASLLAQLAVDEVFIAIGDNFQREAMSARLMDRLGHLELATLVHPSAVLGRDVSIGSGTVVMAGCVIGGGSRIGRGCVVNTSSSLDHEGELGDWSSLAPGVVTGGRVSVGRRSFVGLGAKLKQGVVIGDDTVIGAGSLVLSDVPSMVVAWGAPCRAVRSRLPEERYL